MNYAMPSRDITIDVPIDPSVYLPHHFIALAAESFHDLGFTWMYALMTMTLASRFVYCFIILRIEKMPSITSNDFVVRLVLLAPYMHMMKLNSIRQMLWPELVVRLQRFASTTETQYVCCKRNVIQLIVLT